MLDLLEMISKRYQSDIVKQVPDGVSLETPGFTGRSGRVRMA
jgi:hypothetical protein